MKELSDTTTKALEKYVVTLVKKQPKWLREMFEVVDVHFVLDETGELILSFHETVDEEVRNKACRLIGKYLDKHPSKFMSVSLLN